MKKIIIIGIGILIIGVIFFLRPKDKVPSVNVLENNNTPEESSPAITDIASTTSNQADSVPVTTLTAPLSSARERVTKKPFGIKISPQDSPVSPEKFSGYHTGVDFEILPGEEELEIPVAAICSGPIIFKSASVSGYGGVMAQRCELEEETVTVIYGHLKFSTDTPKVDSPLEAGETLAILGKGYSSETDGERKHLHLGIYKGGQGSYLLGYVKSESALSAWFNILDFLP